LSVIANIAFVLIPQVCCSSQACG